jgi:hypothetical protein
MYVMDELLLVPSIILVWEEDGTFCIEVGWMNLFLGIEFG